MMKRRKICFVTGTRADYGIMSKLMMSMNEDSRVEMQIVATNMHLSPDYGMTVEEIEADGLRVDKRVEMLLSSDTAVGTVKSMGLASIGFADAFSELRPDLIVMLGDRYEMLAAASAALIFGIPVAHLHGGEITEGAYDDSIRHAITKLSYLHFASTEQYRRRIIQMGESPERVFWTGAPAVSNITCEEPMALEELEKSIGHELGKDFMLVTFHPVTKEPGSAERQTESLLTALEEQLPGRKVLVTLPNSDAEGRIIARMIKEWGARHAEDVAVVTSLGRRRYYAALHHCGAVVGNSSSGLCEAPSFRVPTLNIGNRQRGRAKGNTVVDCEADAEAIKSGLRKVLSPEFRRFVAESGFNPYAKEGTMETIHRILVETPLPEQATKRFHDIKFEL